MVTSVSILVLKYMLCLPNLPVAGDVIYNRYNFNQIDSLNVICQSIQKGGECFIVGLTGFIKYTHFIMNEVLERKDHHELLIS